MAIIDRIKFDGPPDGSPWLVHKCPTDRFVLGSQLIVNQGQEALFFRGGEALDLFGAGTHTLKTGNLPLLNSLVNLPFGGKTPFSAEIYYINKTSRLDMNWGTSNPIPFEDPKYGLLLSIRAHGQYGIFIRDSRLFVSRLVGAVPGGATTGYLAVAKYFNGLINSKIKDITANVMGKNRLSFLEITGYLNELSEEYRKAVSGEFERFGIEILNFFVESVSPPKEEYARLRELKEEIALGRDFYTQRRSFDVLDQLASNPSSGGLADAGLGLGMGLGAGSAVGGAFRQMAGEINVAGAQGDASPRCPKCGAPVKEGQQFCGQCGSRVAPGRKCPYCGAEVPAGMKFCGECGRPLESGRCPDCGAENPPGARFCGGCGKKLGGDPV